MAIRTGQKWNRFLNIERLEDRANPDAGFGYAVIGGGLYIEVFGASSGLFIPDMISVSGGTGTSNIVINVDTFSEDPGEPFTPSPTGGSGTPLNYYMEFSAGEIAAAQQTFGAKFKGVHVVTNDGNDVIAATSNFPYQLFAEGGSGNDKITGGTVADKLDGGTGGAGTPTIDGVPTFLEGTGNDTITGNAGSDTITGGDGNDSLVGLTGNDSINAGSGNDFVDGGAGNDIIIGDTGNDSILGGDGDDNVDAGMGNDTVTGGIGNDSLVGGDGNDALTGNDGNDTLVGGDGNDALTGNAGKDSLVGGAGNDTVNADTDDVFLSGGVNTDTLNLSVGNNANLGVVIANDPANQDANGSGFETFNLDAAANVTYVLSANELNNPNTVNVPFVLNAGDTVSFANSTTGRVIDLNNLPNGLAGVGITSVIGTNLDDTILGTGAADSINGGAGNDVIYGQGGNDTLRGGDGNDALYGMAGDDLLEGGPGVDSVYGGAGNDTLLIPYAEVLAGTLNTYRGEGGSDTFAFTGTPGATVSGVFLPTLAAQNNITTYTNALSANQLWDYDGNVDLIDVRS